MLSLWSNLSVCCFNSFSRKIKNKIMCVLNEEDEFNGIISSYRCGMCEECNQEHRNERNEEKAKSTSCGNCGWCSECCD